MPTETPELQPYQLIPVAAVMLALLVWGRVFTARAFAHAPDRRVGLGVADIFVGLALTFIGMWVFGSASRLLGVSVAREAAPISRIAGVLLSQLCVQLPPVLYLLARVGPAPQGLTKIGFVPARPGRDLLAGLAGFLLAVPIVLGVLVASSAVSTWLGYPPEPLSHDLLPLLHDPRSGAAVRILLIAAVVVMAPILEEAIYRGLMQSSLVETLGGRRWPALLVTAAIFAVVHLGSVEPQAIVGLFALGIAFGWLYERTGSLWPGILVHALFNGLNVAMVLLLMEPPAAAPA